MSGDGGNDEERERERDRQTDREKKRERKTKKKERERRERERQRQSVQPPFIDSSRARSWPFSSGTVEQPIFKRISVGVGKVEKRTDGL